MSTGNLLSRIRSGTAKVLAWLRENSSLYFFGLTILAFKLWIALYPFPSDAWLYACFGLVRVQAAQVNSLLNALAGGIGLPAILAILSTPKVLLYLFQPIKLIAAEELRAFFVAPVTILISGTLFVFVIDILIQNHPVKLASSYELLLEIPPGQEGFFFRADVAGTSDQLRLTKNREAFLGGIRLRHNSLLVLRDKYGLTTLELVCMKRSILRTEISDCPDLEPRPAMRKGRSLAGIRRSGKSAFLVYGPLSGCKQRITVGFQLPDYETQVLLPAEGWMEPGEPRDSPEKPSETYALGFFERLYSERESLAEWAQRAYTTTANGTAVLLGLPDYRVEVVFAEQDYRASNDWTFILREASALRVREL